MQNTSNKPANAQIRGIRNWRSEATHFFQHYKSTKMWIAYVRGIGLGVLHRIVPTFVHRALGKIIGWHLMIEAVK